MRRAPRQRLVSRLVARKRREHPELRAQHVTLAGVRAVLARERIILGRRDYGTVPGTRELLRDFH